MVQRNSNQICEGSDDGGIYSDLNNNITNLNLVNFLALQLNCKRTSNLNLEKNVIMALLNMAIFIALF